MIGVIRVKQRNSHKLLVRTISFFSLSLIMSGCTSFSGVRTPKYNGEPFIADEEKIEAYKNAREIIGEEREFYIDEPFSQDLTNPTLDYVDHEPVLLEEGSYVVGEDFGAGRVNIYGTAYDPNMQMIPDPNMPPEFQEVPTFSAGTITIRDSNGALYYKNLFHMMYGNAVAQIDFIEGHTIEISGADPAFVVFYEEEIPENPFIFDPRHNYDLLADPPVIEEDFSEEFEGVQFFGPGVQQPLEFREEDERVLMHGGVFEAGVHFEPGTYSVLETSAMHHTEFYLFRAGEEPRVFEVSDFFSIGMLDPDYRDETISLEIEFQVGDKIYPSYMSAFQIVRISD